MFVVILPVFLLVDLKILTLLLRTFDFWYLFLNGFALFIELSLLFYDARWVNAMGYSVVVLWACCMDAMPLTVRKFASLITVVVLSSLLLNLACVHYSLFPFLYDYSFTIHENVWTLKQLFSTTCVNAIIFLTRYSFLTLWRPKQLLILTARIIPV